MVHMSESERERERKENFMITGKQKVQIILSVQI